MCQHNWQLIKGTYGKFFEEDKWYYKCIKCGSTKKYEREENGTQR